MDKGYKLKESPNDFKVMEDSGDSFGEEGEYSVFRMRKERYNTEDAVQAIAKALRIERKSIGYAGAKDSHAVTEQNISIKGVSQEKVLGLKLKDITLEYLGQRKNPLSLGDLDGNSFDITIRSIKKKPKKVMSFVNYFGVQRFGTNNAEVGKAIIKKDFKKAANLIMDASRRDKEVFEEHLDNNKNDYVGAIKRIPWKNLTMYIHAYQSLLWNEVAKEYSKKHKEDVELPIFGFSTEFDDKEVEKIYRGILSREDVAQNDFIIRAIPDLTSAGNTRPLYCKVEKLQIGKLEDDELNKGMKKCRVQFSLGKGSYATEAIREMMS